MTRPRQPRTCSHPINAQTLTGVCQAVRMVCSLLDNSGTDSAASSGDEMSSSGTNYDLSDPEAGRGRDLCHVETYEDFMTDELVATDTIDSISSTTNVYSEEFTSGTAMDTGESDVTNNDSVNNFGTPTGTVETQNPELCARRGMPASRHGISISFFSTYSFHMFTLCSMYSVTIVTLFAYHFVADSLKQLSSLQLNSQ